MKAQPGSRIEPRDPEPRTGDSQVTERNVEASPRFQARMAGVIAWITITAGFAAIVRGRLILYCDAPATAPNILAHGMFYRVALVGDRISLLHIAYYPLLFHLFMP